MEVTLSGIVMVLMPLLEKALFSRVVTVLGMVSSPTVRLSVKAMEPTVVVLPAIVTVSFPPGTYSSRVRDAL